MGGKLYVVNRHRRIICCTMRDDDLFRMEAYFRANGFVEVEQPEDADLLLMNTCAFDKEREAHCLDLLRELKGCRGRLVVTGCLGRISEKAMRDLFDGPYIPPPRLEAELDRVVGAPEHPFPGIVVHGRERTMYNAEVWWRKQTKPADVPPSGVVKIVNGCPQHCAYCTHRLAIGQKAVSVPRERIVELIGAQVDSGARVIQLLGDNLGPYGRDIGSHLPDLVSHLAERFPGVRYALDQYHPAYFTQDYPRGLREAIRRGLIYELKMPIQSGSPRVLEAMQRPTRLDLLAEQLEEALSLAPRLLLVTHIITGFPSETEAEFRESVDYVRRAFRRNALVFIFPCSVHPDTPAAAIDPKVPPEESMRRALEAEADFVKAGIDVCLDHLDVLKARKHA